MLVLPQRAEKHPAPIELHEVRESLAGGHHALAPSQPLTKSMRIAASGLFGWSAVVNAGALVPEQRDEDDDWNWNANQPEQRTFTETHKNLQYLSSK